MKKKYAGAKVGNTKDLLADLEQFRRNYRGLMQDYPIHHKSESEKRILQSGKAVVRFYEQTLKKVYSESKEEDVRMVVGTIGHLARMADTYVKKEDVINLEALFKQRGVSEIDMRRGPDYLDISIKILKEHVKGREAVVSSFE